MPQYQDTIKQRIEASIAAKQQILADDKLMQTIGEVVTLIVTAYQTGNKVLFCGNGGSAADSMHLATELSGRFYIDRKPLNAEALHADPTFLTAIGNDYDFSETFARLLEARAQPGDVLMALSTSGNSPNVVKAAQKGWNLNLQVIGFTGSKDADIDKYCDKLIKAPSTDTPRIQECHLLIGHIICELVEQTLFA